MERLRGAVRGRSYQGRYREREEGADRRYVYLYFFGFIGGPSSFGALSLYLSLSLSLFLSYRADVYHYC